VTSHGDYYYDPEAPDSLLTFRYASIPIGVIYPSVPYTVIENLVIPPFNSYLTETAFYQVGEPYDGDTSPHPDGPGDGDDLNDNCNPGCPNYPCCKLGWIDCGTVICGNDPYGPLPCPPGSPDWPACLDLFLPDDPPYPDDPNSPGQQYCECTEYTQGNAGITWRVWIGEDEDCSDYEMYSNNYWVDCNTYTPPPPPQPVFNACGCPNPVNIRWPAGCIRVDDDGSNVPVQNVMVKVKDTWFTSDITFTSTQGCWQVSKAYYGKMWMFVQFDNENCEVRAVRNFNAELEEGQPFPAPMFWKALVVADDYVGDFDGPVFNNVDVLYSSGLNEPESLARMYWACAHIINSDAEYRENCIADGVPLPRQGLNYLLKSSIFIAGAPMLQGHPFSQAGQLLFSLRIPWVISSIVEINGGGILSPDVVRGYNNETAADFRRVNMHELGHTSHYSLVGESYWYHYRTHIVQNDLAGNGVYGSFGNFAPLSDPDRVALGEAIGEYTENIYGRRLPLDNIDFIDNFIPAGLMYDLQDDTPTEIVTDPNNSAIFGPDNINGCTPGMIFGALTPNVNSIRQFRDRLSTTSLPMTLNTLANFNNFVDIYDVFN
jgi:hypothetical protein